MPNIIKTDTPLNQSASSSQTNTSFTLADVMRKSKLIDDKLCSYESKFSIINNTLTNMQASISSLRDENVVMKDEIGKLRSKVIIFESNYITNNAYSPKELIHEAQC
jgi:septation ring formation regulator EzrA